MSELHLRVFGDRSELVTPDGTTHTFLEGASGVSARERYRLIEQTLQAGWLHNQITRCKENPGSLTLDAVSETHGGLLDAIVGSMTSEQGRALIGLTVLQLTVKSIAPEQSIRLHKGGQSSRDFSWREGVSMRSLDKRFITPALRQYGLLSLNADGFMMTRSLAENYPYSKVYKAHIRGARSEWASLVEAVESGQIASEPALHYLLSRLLNNAQEFKSLADNTVQTANALIAQHKLDDQQSVLDVILKHVDESNYAARIMEIAMHALMQAVQEAGVLAGKEVLPLSQMRSANKKHGNIGDIEIVDNDQIIESWDAKFGKSYLRDELEELNDKLAMHPLVERAGFVTSSPPERLDEIEPRLLDIAEAHGISLEIVTLTQWVDEQFRRSTAPGYATELARRWITAYVESLAQQRLTQAPIDEPCYQWLHGLRSIMQSL